MKTESASSGSDEVRCQLWEAVCLGCGTDDVSPALHKLHLYQSKRESLMWCGMVIN